MFFPSNPSKIFEFILRGKIKNFFPAYKLSTIVVSEGNVRTIYSKNNFFFGHSRLVKWKSFDSLEDYTNKILFKLDLCSMNTKTFSGLYEFFYCIQSESGYLFSYHAGLIGSKLYHSVQQSHFFTSIEDLVLSYILRN